MASHDLKNTSVNPFLRLAQYDSDGSHTFLGGPDYYQKKVFVDAVFLSKYSRKSEYVQGTPVF